MPSLSTHNLAAAHFLHHSQAGDCLCLALDVERPEAAIMDPTRLIIKVGLACGLSACMNNEL
jgi:hypothetical protein